MFLVYGIDTCDKILFHKTIDFILLCIRFDSINTTKLKRELSKSKQHVKEILLDKYQS